MISSASSPDRAPRAESLSVASNGASRAPIPLPDRLSVARTSFLRAELLRQPEIRPEVVARGRELAADPAYPDRNILKEVARQILAAPDLTNDEA